MRHISSAERARAEWVTAWVQSHVALAKNKVQEVYPSVGESWLYVVCPNEKYLCCLD